MNEAELLFTEVLSCSRTDLYARRREAVSPETARAIAGVLKRRASGEPLQYILGKADFMGFEFLVTADVLIPRPETELLVETVVTRMTGVRVLDLGTGSGCIAVSLAKILDNACITASDVSQAALEVAEKNARALGVSHRIEFVHSDVFARFENRVYDCIVSNPPYIASGDIAGLQKEVRYEPRLALDGGSDGLDFYRRLSREAVRFLAPRGLLCMEAGFNQCQAIKNIFSGQPEFTIIDTVKDYNQIDRVLVLQRKG